MPRAAKYWAYVREGELWAKKTPDEQDRKIFYDMAKDWAELALREQTVLKIDAMSAR